MATNAPLPPATAAEPVESDPTHACSSDSRPSYVSHPTYLRYRLERIANVEAKLAEIRREWEARGKGAR